MKFLRRLNNKNLLALCVVIGGLVGCGGGDGSGMQASPPVAPPPPPPPPFAAAFSAIQSNVFTPTCATAGCHSGAGAPQGLLLDDANSYGLLVNRASNQVPALLRVAPSDPDNSYLIQKLEGTASVGGQMPLGGQPLTQPTIDVIRQWITDGAMDDRAPSADPIRVTSLAPLPDTDLAASPTEIVAMFDRELDVSTVNATTFVVEGSGGDGTFNDGNETSVTAASISTPAMAPMSATFDLGGTVLGDDTYRIRLLGSGASVILDIDANALDGEFTGAFPSGDGAAGGDFEATFTVTTPGQMSPTLEDIQAAVFGPTCSSAGCHSGPAGNTLPSGLDLTTADASFNSLVGVMSIREPAFLRVAAGDPDNSYLIRKLEGTNTSGSRMPLGGGPLDQAVIDDIREWILDGAAR